MRVILLLLCLVSVALKAQQVDYPIDTIEGKPYYRYTVEKGVGLYRVSKIFNIPQELILQANPSIQQRGLVYGGTIWVPISIKEDVFVKPKEKKISPRKVIVAPLELQQQDTIVEVLDDTLQVGIASDTLRLAMMLPLHANTTQRNASMERFMDFYMGALIAIYEMQQAGQFVELYTYDVEKTTVRLGSILSDSVWHDVDAIIGPAYGQQVQKVATFTERDSTWMLVPFISDIKPTHNNPNVFQFNPSAQAEAEALAEYLAASVDSINCVVIQPKEGESIPKSVQEIHAALKRYNIPTTSTTIREILVDSVGDAFVMDKENIVIFNTEKYSNLQAVMPHLLQAVGTHRITLLSRYSWQNEKIVLPQIYTSVFYEELVSPEAYEELYATYFDTKPSAQSPRYDLLGYDLTKHFIELLQSSDTTLLSEDWIGVQSAIQYQPSSVHAGYENKKISVIRK